MSLTRDQIDELKARHPVPEIAGQYVRLRRARGKWSHKGPCPICSPRADSKTAARFECTADKWVCGACQAGGDVIALVAGINHLDAKADFARIVDLLGGAAAPGEVTPAAATRAGRAAYHAGARYDAVPDGYPIDCANAWRAGWHKAKRQEEFAAAAREKERKRLFYNFWQPALQWPGTPVETYLRGRGLDVPCGAWLRFHPDMPLFADGRENEPRLLYSGPAMLAAIVVPHPVHGIRFSGLHITWLDTNGPKGKLSIVDPETGEAMPSKKVRGHKAGGFIDLGGLPQIADAPVTSNSPLIGSNVRFTMAVPLRMFAGEGIESTLAVYTAMRRAGKCRAGDFFRSAVDLGNLAGKALDRLPHPTLKSDVCDRQTGEVIGQRTVMVLGEEPDLESDAMPVPETVRELVLLGDGDSDAFTTRCAMARAAKRHQRAILRSQPAPLGAGKPTNVAPPGAADQSSPASQTPVVRVIWPRPGLDFNDMLQGKDATK